MSAMGSISEFMGHYTPIVNGGIYVTCSYPYAQRPGSSVAVNAGKVSPWLEHTPASLIRKRGLALRSSPAFLFRHYGTYSLPSFVISGLDPEPPVTYTHSLNVTCKQWNIGLSFKSLYSAEIMDSPLQPSPLYACDPIHMDHIVHIKYVLI